MKRGEFKKPNYEDALKKKKATQARLRKKKVASGTKSAKKAKKPARAKNKPKKAPSIKLLKKKLWEECKRITRARFEHTCYTCGAMNLEGSNLHTGHGKPKGALSLKFQYDIRNLRPQCMKCNVHLGGCQDIFLSKLEQEQEGYQFLIEACYFDLDAQAWIIKRDVELIRGKDSTIFVQNLLEEYKQFKV